MTPILDSKHVAVYDMAEVGGGRGVVAITDIQPGQVVLREAPLITVPADKADEETLHVALARAVMQHPSPGVLLTSMRDLHPTTLDALDPHVRQTVTEQHAQDVDTLLTPAAAGDHASASQDCMQHGQRMASSKLESESDQTPAADHQNGSATNQGHGIIHHAKQLHHNSSTPTSGEGSESKPSICGVVGKAEDSSGTDRSHGRQQHTADGVGGSSEGCDHGSSQLWTRESVLRLLLVLRFNAHPSGLYIASEMFNHRCCPNAIKLAVGGVSEVRALRPIPLGTQVTISYVDPPLQSYARRCALLETQHFFRPSADQGYPWDMEAWHPQVSCELKERLHECEQQLQALEDQLDALEGRSTAACAALNRQAREWEAVEARAARQRRTARRQLKEGACQGGEVSKQPDSLPAAATGNQRGPPHVGNSSAAASMSLTATTFLDRVAQLLAETCSVRRQAAQLLHPRHVALARTHELIVSLSSALLAAASSMPPPKPQRLASLAAAATPDAVDAQPGQEATPASPAGQATAGGRSSWFLPGLDLSWDQPASEAKSVITEEMSHDPADVALLLLRACVELRHTQDLYACPGHYDTVRTLLDMQQTLEYLLGMAPKRLYAAFPELYGTFASASRAAHALHKEHTRSAALWA